MQYDVLSKAFEFRVSGVGRCFEYVCMRRYARLFCSMETSVV